ncbi:anti-sigma regulatory factor (Ser/Thr protein kinase) [Streptosporangium becharense]|uniref:Anti-sigma regulatory factor (Ser/Thr protein kinase) n=1 Tax=Streptosporangium becharense TaxID=1816182 RepID=A0A7W9IMN6_9ACTN|nr:ATP-binding protein [Streptosporangium becharense]MBB2914466.1 anti-sigma regulatory factor (Ser/Thr protein kinase) [Streptosporangium becharense]MBB5823502.1 anti-sigma regulatory factor (Ser/Thr protein kinase) [Streptosporangium becharense]
MLDHVLPPNGLPPWAGGEGHVGQIQMAVRSLRHDPCAARTAREFATRALTSWELESLIDDTGVVLAELVTNAVRHGTHSLLDPRPAPDVRVVLCRTERSVLCAVTDPSDQAPRLREPDYEAENGRGLQLVEGVSETWGWAPLETRGKAVWAVFALPPAPRHLEACH